MNETALAALLCAFVLGEEPEVNTKLDNQGSAKNRYADCVTPEFAIEVGLDGKSSARDSVHQAVLYAKLLGRRPMVVVIDRDNVEDAYQQELRIVTEALDLDFAVCKADFLVRWAATRSFRHAGAGAKYQDFPQGIAQDLHCDLGPLVSLKAD